MTHVSGRNPVRDAARAKAIVVSGQSVFLDGDPRQLRKIRDLLKDDGQVKTFFGNDGDDVVLWVGPRNVQGSIVWEPRMPNGT